MALIREGTVVPFKSPLNKEEVSMGKIDKVEHGIMGILDNIAQELDGEVRSKKWTKRIKDEICKLAEKYECNADASGYKDTSEWLFDLIWWTKSKDNYFLELILAMECEWSLGGHDIWVDFEKLLIARTKYRIFIFEQKLQDEVREYFKEFKKAIQKFKGTQAGDRYLLAGFSFDTGKFSFEPIICGETES